MSMEKFVAGDEGLEQAERLLSQAYRAVRDNPEKFDGVIIHNHDGGYTLGITYLPLGCSAWGSSMGLNNQFTSVEIKGGREFLEEIIQKA